VEFLHCKNSEIENPQGSGFSIPFQQGPLGSAGRNARAHVVKFPASLPVRPERFLPYFFSLFGAVTQPVISR
jgi:hypothetical protein